MVEKKTNGTARILTEVSHRKIYTQPWTIFFKLIKGQIIDPKARNELWVYGSQPKWFIEGTSESEINDKYPILIIPNSTINNQENYTLDYSAKQYTPQIVFEVYSDRNDYLDDITDNINQIILDNESFLKDCGIYNIKISNDSINPETRGGLKIFHRILGISFEVVTCQ